MTKDQIRNNVTKNVKYIRKQLNYTQQQMADRCGIEFKTAQAIEEGRSMAVEGIIKIADFAKISLDTIYKTDMTLPSVPEEFGLMIGIDSNNKKAFKELHEAKKFGIDIK